MKVLVVDDEPDVGGGVSRCFGLRWPDAEVIAAANAEEALSLIEAQQPDLVLLDIMLPGMDGFQLCREIRSFSDVPIMMLTARDAEVEKGRGLGRGADASITNPASPLDPRAPTPAPPRRYQSQLPAIGEVFESGDLRIDYASRSVTIRGRPVRLTPSAYSLLYHPPRNPGRVPPH